MTTMWRSNTTGLTGKYCSTELGVAGMFSRSPEDALTIADLLLVLAAPTLGLFVKHALEAFLSLQLQRV
jgi:hypothetical protein